MDNTESLLTFEELLSAVHGKYVGFSGSSDNFCFTSVVIDSRNVKEKSLFVPLIGEFQDGHKYIPEALAKGASVVFVTKSVYSSNVKFYMDLISNYKNVVFIVVENNLRSLQEAARFYVKKFPKLIKISVTGSSGKTTTKEIAVSILKQKYNVISNIGNLNSETGLPLSVFNIRNEHEVGLFEMGMNRVNEIGEIANVLRPNYGIITNIGNAHIGILGSMEKISEEKKKSLSFIKADGVAFIPASDKFANFLSSNVKGKTVKYGEGVSEKISGVK